MGKEYQSPKQVIQSYLEERARVIPSCHFLHKAKQKY